MRPERLQVEGFTSFRERAEVDFDGAEVFAFTGATGSGKSSLVDAMGFALYGRVHRYGEKLVHAAISQGKNEARVRFDFTAGGSQYTAVRVVRRTGPGRATTKEARLERDGEVLAGDEKGLTTAVVELLGLDFEQYCRCVVLPQGAFAAFLHDTPKGRQDLLTSLLDLGHYRAMAQEAGQRASTARNRADILEERLTGDLAGATSEALDDAAVVVARLEELAARVDGMSTEVEALAVAAADATARTETARAQSNLLRSVQVPDGVSGIATMLLTARAEETAARQMVEQHEQRVAAAELARAGLGDRRVIDAALDGHRRRRQVLERSADAERRLVAATVALSDAEESAAATEQERTRADKALEAARTANRSHAVAATLAVGEPCPVCQQSVHVLPELREPADFAIAQQALKSAEAATKAAASLVQGQRETSAKAAAAVAELERQLSDIAAVLQGFEDEKLALAALATIEAAEDEVVSARRAEAAARRAAKGAADRLHHANDTEREARRAFETARDRVAPLGPPTADRLDLAADWAQLAAWAGLRATEIDGDLASALAVAEEAGRSHRKLVDEIAGWCRDAGVEVGSAAPLTALAGAQARAAEEHRRVAAAIADVGRIRAETAGLRETEQVAHALALHLRADRFEKWLLDEAIDELTEGATALLQELSGGAYSLVLETKSRDFAVVDHRNADEARPVRTLSGGETFLASLALALALADRVAELATSGSVRLEALFLDEGFGTLDADTLDVVAAAIENLGASGRMVGIVTHVRELAERVPVRFEVTKGPRTSTVNKVTS